MAFHLLDTVLSGIWSEVMLTNEACKMLLIKFRQFDEKYLILNYKSGIENKSEHSLRSHVT